MRSLLFILLALVTGTIPEASAQNSCLSRSSSSSRLRSYYRQREKEAHKWAQHSLKDYIDLKNTYLKIFRKIKDESSLNHALKQLNDIQKNADIQKKDLHYVQYGQKSYIVKISKNTMKLALEVITTEQSRALKELLPREKVKIDRAVSSIKEESARIEEAGLLTDELQEWMNHATSDFVKMLPSLNLQME